MTHLFSAPGRGGAGPEGVIFDLDGVLCRTDRYHLLAWGELAASLGLNLPADAAERTRGVGRMESLEIVLGSRAGRFTAEQKLALAERKNRLYRARLGSLTPADAEPGAAGALEELRRRGLRTAVASSSRNAPLILEKLGLAALLDAVVDGGMISRSKPDPEVFLTAARLLGLPPGRCAVVEDAASGIEAARRGGFRAIAYTGGERRLPVADAEISSLDQLPALFSRGGAGGFSG